MPTVSEMFVKQLIQIPNASSEKAAAIIKVYPTVAQLVIGVYCCIGWFNCIVVQS